MATPVATSSLDVAPGPAQGNFPPFQSETFASQLLWFALAFGALYLLMSRVALPRIGGIIENRHVTIARDLDEAARLRTDAEAAGQAYEASVAAARARSQALAQEARSRVSALADAKRKALESDLGQRLAEAEATISAGKEAAMANVRGIAHEVTTAIVERITGRPPAAQAVDAALDQTHA